MKEKQEVVGVVDIGYEQCQLVAREGTGGEFYFIPEKGIVPRIKIGIQYNNFDEVITCLLHEALEFSLYRIHGRFAPSEDLAKNHASYQFCFDHNQFTEARAATAEFITVAMPELAKIYNQWKNEQKKKKRKKK